MQRLQELHLQENSIELLAEQALSGLSSLALLDLSRNHLRTLGASSLKPLVSLQVLRVTGRRSKERIPEHTVSHCNPSSSPDTKLISECLEIFFNIVITSCECTATATTNRFMEMKINVFKSILQMKEFYPIIDL